MTEPARRGLLVLAFGGPHRSEDVRPFLRDVLAGRPIPESRFEAVVQHYELLGGRSPIYEHTERQARALEAALAARGEPFEVRVGMRHWSPWIRDALREFQRRGFTEVLGLIMAAQETEASQARYLEAVERARGELGAGAPRVRLVTGWGLAPGVIDAHAERAASALAELPPERRSGAALLFSAHSIPRAMAQDSPYVAQLEEAARRVAHALGRAEYALVYQSRSGNPREPWLEPDVLDALAQLRDRGARDVLISPIGFVCDHVEVLYDLDVEARARAEALGLGFSRAATPGTHPAFIGALADRVLASLSADEPGAST
jgi:ferrochelatase